MGGDQLVAEVAGDEVEDDKGDEIRAAEEPLYMAMIEEVEPFEGASELIVRAEGARARAGLASSAKSDEVDHYLDLLERPRRSTAGPPRPTSSRPSPSPTCVRPRWRRRAPATA